MMTEEIKKKNNKKKAKTKKKEKTLSQKKNLTMKSDRYFIVEIKYNF